MKEGGTVITVSGDDQVTSKRGITVRQMQHHRDTQEKVLELLADIDEGRIQLTLEHIYPFEEALDALKKTETRHARGKLVVTI